MDQQTNKIRQHIDTEREQLGRNLYEIENRVKSATDLKGHFDKNVGWVLGAAVAGGFLLSLAVGKSSTSRRTARPQPDSRSAYLPAQPKEPFTAHFSRVSNTVEDIIDGLVGVFSVKLHSFVADAVPGFREQFDAIEQQRNSPVH